MYFLDRPSFAPMRLGMSLSRAEEAWRSDATGGLSENGKSQSAEQTHGAGHGRSIGPRGVIHLTLLSNVSHIGVSQARHRR